MSDHVFISYVHADGSWVAEELSRALQCREIDTWRDVERLHPGDDWDQLIDAAIAGCSVFLYFVTERTKHSDEARGELKRARQFERRLIPVLVGSEVDIPRSLLSVEYIDCRHGVNEQVSDAVIAAIKKEPILTRTAKPAARKWQRGLLMTFCIAWLAGLVCGLGAIGARQWWSGAAGTTDSAQASASNPAATFIPSVTATGLIDRSPRPGSSSGRALLNEWDRYDSSPTDKKLVEFFKKRLNEKLPTNDFLDLLNLLKVPHENVSGRFDSGSVIGFNFGPPDSVYISGHGAAVVGKTQHIDRGIRRWKENLSNGSSVVYAVFYESGNFHIDDLLLDQRRNSKILSYATPIRSAPPWDGLVTAVLLQLSVIAVLWRRYVSDEGEENAVDA